MYPIHASQIESILSIKNGITDVHAIQTICISSFIPPQKGFFRKRSVDEEIEEYQGSPIYVAIPVLRTYTVHQKSKMGTRELLRLASYASQPLYHMMIDDRSTPTPYKPHSDKLTLSSEAM
ncbi:hypothetical protein Tco_0916864 [Tanacetum coccineum]